MPDTFQRQFKLDLVLPVHMEEETTFAGRYYTTPEGYRYPSVSTFLSATKPEKEKATLENWRKRVGHEEAEAISQKSRDRGTAFHKLCEDYVIGKTVTLSEKPSEAEVMFRTVVPILNRGITKVYGVEIAGASNRLKIAGRSDQVSDWLGVPSIIDFKNSLRPKRMQYIADYLLQCTAYSFIMNETYPLIPPIEQVVIVIGVLESEPQIFQHTITPEDRKAVIRRVYQFHKMGLTV